MIYGIGTDICDIRRIRSTLERRGLRFAEKVLGPNEMAVFLARRAKVEARGVAWSDVAGELAGRMGMSGLEEKAARPKA